MKRIIILWIAFLAIQQSYGQDLNVRGIARSSNKEKSFTLTPKGSASEIILHIENFYGDVLIAAVNTPDLEISTKGYEGVPEKAKGLKPLSATGTDNTDIGLSVVQEGNVIKVSGASRKADGHYTFKVPKNMKVKADLNSWQGGDFVGSGLANEVDVKTQNGDIILRNVTGPIVASSLSGDIDVIYETVKPNAQNSITSTSGDIDVTIPANTSNGFKLSTISGEIYTDIDFDVQDKEGMNRIGGGYDMKVTLNNGGINILLKTISGDIYIRKAE